jgi:hypothetical protein
MLPSLCSLWTGTGFIVEEGADKVASGWVLFELGEVRPRGQNVCLSIRTRSKGMRPQRARKEENASHRKQIHAFGAALPENLLRRSPSKGAAERLE